MIVLRAHVEPLTDRVRVLNDNEGRESEEVDHNEIPRWEAKAKEVPLLTDFFDKSCPGRNQSANNDIFFETPEMILFAHNSTIN